MEFNGIMKLALQALTEVMDSSDIISESGGLVKNSEIVMSYIWKILNSICENQQNTSARTQETIQGSGIGWERFTSETLPLELLMIFCRS